MEKNFLSSGKFARLASGERGFTLIELLIVMLMIGILATLGIPAYTRYRVRALDSTALSDLRNAVAAQEAYFLQNSSYQQCSGGGCSSLPGFVISNGTSLEMEPDAGGQAFAATAQHSAGSKLYSFLTVTGRVVSVP